MSDADLFPSLLDLNVDELLAVRAQIDLRLEEKRSELLVQANRLSDAIGGKKRHSRKPKSDPRPS